MTAFGGIIGKLSRVQDKLPEKIYTKNTPSLLNLDDRNGIVVSRAHFSQLYKYGIRIVCFTNIVINTKQGSKF